MKIHFFGGRGSGLAGQGGCERRSEAFLKIQETIKKQLGGRSGRRVRVFFFVFFVFFLGGWGQD